MLNLERRREERRERSTGNPDDQTPEGQAPDGAHASADYGSVVDNLIRNAISSDSEAFNQQAEQENGQ